MNTQSKKLVVERSISLRLPADKLAETLEFAAEEGRTASNFVRRVYLIGLEQYRKAQQPQGAQA